MSVMKSMKTKLLIMLMSVIMVFALAPLSADTAHADGIGGTCGDNVRWMLDTETGVMTISGSGPMYDYSNDFNSQPWSDKNYLIKSIVVEKGVTKIGEYAFNYCERVTSITLPDGLEEIGGSAFFRCPMTELTIPDSVTAIGGYAFVWAKMKTVTIPGSVESIGARTFSGCENLTSVKLEDGVKSIGAEAFYCCESLTSIAIPASVTSIDDTAFDWYAQGSGSYLSPTVGFVSEQGSYAELYAANKGIPARLDLAKAQITVPDVTYTGQELTPTPMVAINGMLLTENTHYLVSYRDNVNPGEAVVIVAGMGEYGNVINKTFTIDKLAQAVTVPKASYTKTFGNSAFTISATTDGDGTLKYSSNNTKVATVSTAGKVTIKGAGTAKITVYAAEGAYYKKSGSKTITVTVNKAKNTMTVKGKTASVKYTSLKKKARKVSRSSVIALSKAKGTVTYTKKSGNKKITIAKTGKVTVKKGLDKGIYAVKVKVKAAGTTNYKALTKTVTFKIKVK